MTTASLKESPLPFYLLCCDEPLLLRDWLDAARADLKQGGFDDIQTQSAEANFDWNALLDECGMMSLFSDQKCRIIQIHNGKPGQKGSKAIQGLCEAPPDDTVFIFVIPKLDRQTKSSSWVKNLLKQGELVEVKPIYPNQLASWLVQRAARKSLTIDQQSAEFLAERTEGNLLAADQELEKLSLRFADQSSISFEAIEQSVGRSARYNHFVLIDACLEGRSKRAIKVLASLQAEGYVTNQLSWVLQSTLEQLARLKQAQMQGSLSPKLWQELRIWSSKQRLFQSALKRLGNDQIERLLQSCATLDRLNKGQQDSDFTQADWIELRALICAFCGLKSLSSPHQGC